MAEEAKREQVAITQEQLILAIYEELTAFNTFPEIMQKKATTIGSWVWRQMMHNQRQNRKHMERLIYLVDQMRTLQKAYWNGSYSKLPASRVAENQVDDALKVLITELGYSIEELKSRYEQTKLWDGPQNKG